MKLYINNFIMKTTKILSLRKSYSAPALESESIDLNSACLTASVGIADNGIDDYSTGDPINL